MVCYQILQRIHGISTGVLYFIGSISTPPTKVTCGLKFGVFCTSESIVISSWSDFATLSGGMNHRDDALTDGGVSSLDGDSTRFLSYPVVSS